MRVYVGVTDGAWYRFLAARPYLSEVNFWMPGGGRRRMADGEPFAFKLHKADGGGIVGGGLFAGSLEMPVSDAWRVYGEGNGVASLEEMRASVGRYRAAPIEADEDPAIGCVLLRDVFFVEPERSLPPPAAWSANLVQGMFLAEAEVDGNSTIEWLLAGVVERGFGDPQAVPGEVFGPDQMRPSRPGQQAFKLMVLGAYHGRCAVTGERIRPVLEAAHIRPVNEGGLNRVDNGLLLRSDVHTLFDAGYLGVDPKMRLMVSPRLRAEFDNGEEFYERAGSEIAIPERRADRPAREFLEWHADTCFRT
jgi:putative restriction endonuclease